MGTPVAHLAYSPSVPPRKAVVAREIGCIAPHDHEVARTLQEAMLTRLPIADGLTMAGRYLPAVGQHRVGGDWYDALTLADGATALVIGDVMGHDIAAAAAMGQLRSMLRMLVYDRREAPSSLLGRLDRALPALGVSTLATVVLAHVAGKCASSRGGRAVRWTNAGHPSPVIVNADGTVDTFEGESDMLLGARPETARRDYACVVPSGSTMFFCTDGLIETSVRTAEVGRRRLKVVLGRNCGLAPEELVDAVIADMVETRGSDDIAVLAVRVDS